MSKTAEEIQEELWQKHSILLGTDISDLDYYAGRCIMTESAFQEAIKEYSQSKIQELEKENERLRGLLKEAHRWALIEFSQGSTLTGDESFNEFKKHYNL